MCICANDIVVQCYSCLFIQVSVTLFHIWGNLTLGSKYGANSLISMPPPQKKCFCLLCTFLHMTLWCSALYQGAPGHGKSWNLGRPFCRPGKSWKIAKVMEKSWKMMVMSWNFYYCTEQFCKSDTTSFVRSNYEPFYLFNNGTMSRWNCHH